MSHRARRRKTRMRSLAEGLERRTLMALVVEGFVDELIAGGAGTTLSSPTSMAFAPDGRLFVAQQGGRLRVVKNGALLPTPFVDVFADTFAERGLAGVALDPNFAANGYVYLYHTVPAGPDNTPPAHNRVTRFTANPA